MVDLNLALRAYQENRFTDDDIVGCTGLTTRALRELLKVGAVRSITERRGPGLVRLFDTTTLKRAAIIASLHAAGFSLATAGRIAYFVPFEELLFAVCDPFTSPVYARHAVKSRDRVAASLARTTSELVRPESGGRG